MEIELNKLCPFLSKEDPGNPVAVDFDPEVAAASEAFCNHGGVPCVEFSSDGLIKSKGRIVASCKGCKDFPKGFVEIPVK